LPDRLSRRTLGSLPTAVRRPRYDVDAISTGIVHFGPGAFFRAHIASYVDDLLEHDPRWGISAVALRSGALAHQGPKPMSGDGGAVHPSRLPLRCVAPQVSHLRMTGLAGRPA